MDSLIFAIHNTKNQDNNVKQPSAACASESTGPHRMKNCAKDFAKVQDDFYVRDDYMETRLYVAEPRLVVLTSDN